MANVENETIVQIAIVVDDIEKYLDSYAKVFGIERPTWRLTDTQDVTHARYMGKETQARAKLAFIRFANITLEIIEPVGEPSSWASYLKTHGPSVHHIAFRYKDKKPTLDKLTQTLKVIHTGEFKGGNYTYLDAFDKLGMDIEILENPGM